MPRHRVNIHYPDGRKSAAWRTVGVLSASMIPPRGVGTSWDMQGFLIAGTGNGGGGGGYTIFAGDGLVSTTVGLNQTLALDRPVTVDDGLF
jgi:hypothetical protein